MYKTLDLKNRRTSLFGAYSAYFRLSKRRGVKVYNAGEFPHNAAICEYRADIDFSQVETDFEFIRRIECHIVPKAYKIVAVKLKGLWYPGIILEHVDGVHLDKLTPGRGILKNQTCEELMRDISTIFAKLTGYIHYDLNGYNVIFQRKAKTFKVIDLCLEYAAPSGDIDDDISEAFLNQFSIHRQD